MKKIYKNYFEKNKPFRHHTQHLIFSTVILYLLKTFGQSMTWQNIVTYYAFTFIIDVDGLATVRILKSKNNNAKEILIKIRQFKLIEAAELGVTHHKQFNRSLFHNVYGFALCISFLIISIISGNSFMYFAIFSVFAHFVFDIIDDYAQLGHLKNWFWMFTDK